ncbi:hypothetical protein [Acidipropionibacterium virtanenii]|uniref:Uncharacterized protein n=1 Tax=Acidipropionibacterium virtanenii TaxID=2057246 RepID=A0A344UWH4_9ACTN|nr:hypothetical protein [Acidipropionibacterium virtanenii]AXE39622.1 hypothetical protein JS278_02484 [Acidipropionibacterium virtanenii]
MAEIRKHKPSSGAIAQALAAAMGEPIRPTAPGSKPFDDEDEDPGTAAHGPARSASSAPVNLSEVGSAAGWKGITVASLPKKKVVEESDEDEDD